MAHPNFEAPTEAQIFRLLVLLAERSIFKQANVAPSERTIRIGIEQRHTMCSKHVFATMIEALSRMEKDTEAPLDLRLLAELEEASERWDAIKPEPETAAWYNRLIAAHASSNDHMEGTGSWYREAVRLFELFEGDGNLTVKELRERYEEILAEEDEDEQGDDYQRRESEYERRDIEWDMQRAAGESE